MPAHSGEERLVPPPDASSPSATIVYPLDSASPDSAATSGTPRHSWPLFVVPPSPSSRHGRLRFETPCW
jgi:hypothetical protein